MQRPGLPPRDRELTALARPGSPPTTGPPGGSRQASPYRSPEPAIRHSAHSRTQPVGSRSAPGEATPPVVVSSAVAPGGGEVVAGCSTRVPSASPGGSRLRRRHVGLQDSGASTGCDPRAVRWIHGFCWNNCRWWRPLAMARRLAAGAAKGDWQLSLVFSVVPFAGIGYAPSGLRAGTTEALAVRPGRGQSDSTGTEFVPGLVSLARRFRTGWRAWTAPRCHARGRRLLGPVSV